MQPNSLQGGNNSFIGAAADGKISDGGLALAPRVVVCGGTNDNGLAFRMKP